MTSPLFDSHAHYDDEKLYGEADLLLQKVHSEGVAKIINVGSNFESIKRSKELSEKYSFVYMTAGIHPQDAATDGKKEGWLREVAHYCSYEKTVAIGEIGLDYHYGADEKEEQKACFISQMELADRLMLPVVIHDREAHGGSMEIISAFPRVKGVFHSYSGSAEMAKELFLKGYYISINGVVTFNNAKKLREIIRNLRSLHKDALSRILIETDCPYLTPHPYRGQVNHSGYMKYTAMAASELLGMSYDDFVSLTYRNAMEFYHLGGTA